MNIQANEKQYYKVLLFFIKCLFIILFIPFSETNLYSLSVGAYVENDVLFPVDNQDRDYTGGGGLYFSGDIFKWYPVQLFHDLFFDKILIASKYTGNTELYSLSFGVMAFTPDDLRKYEVDETDRPYASLTYLQSSKMVINEKKDRSVTSGFTLGVLGNGTARDVQRRIHEDLRLRGGSSPDPKGWDHQISNGGEATILYNLSLRNLEIDKDWGCFTFQITTNYNLNLGYFTNVNYGIDFRFGIVNSHFYGFNKSPFNNRIYNELDKSKGFELYVFSASRVTWVYYNAMLQGQFRGSDYKLSEDQIERLVTEFNTGISLSFYGLNVTWIAVAGRTAEHKLESSRSHRWGSIFLSFTHNI